jgi:hypothetical protein
MHWCIPAQLIPARPAYTGQFLLSGIFQPQVHGYFDDAQYDVVEAGRGYLVGPLVHVGHWLSEFLAGFFQQACLLHCVGSLFERVVVRKDFNAERLHFKVAAASKVLVGLHEERVKILDRAGQLSTMDVVEGSAKRPFCLKVVDCAVLYIKSKHVPGRCV